MSGAVLGQVVLGGVRKQAKRAKRRKLVSWVCASSLLVPLNGTEAPNTLKFTYTRSSGHANS